MNKAQRAKKADNGEAQRENKTSTETKVDICWNTGTEG